MAGQSLVRAAAILQGNLERAAKMAQLLGTAHHWPESLAGVSCEWVAADNARDAPTIVMYLHGGAFACGSARTHLDLASRLSAASGAKVLLVDYRLTPQYVFPAALEDVVGVYRALLAHGTSHGNIALAGESAGANLALAAIVMLQDFGVPLPAACVCISPWLDLTHSARSICENTRTEKILPTDMLLNAARVYAAGAELDNPRISPLFADLAGCPPLLVVAGSDELLVDDARRLAEQARAAGVMVRYREWTGQPHAFPALGAFLPEARAAILHVAEFLGGQWN